MRLRVFAIAAIASLVTLAISNPVGANPKTSRYLAGRQSGLTFSHRSFTFEWEYVLYDGRQVSSWIGGDSPSPPSYVVKSLRLWIADSEIPVPADAYLDIYDPCISCGGPHLMEDAGVLYLVIDASDGSGAAHIWLKFSDQKYMGRDIKELYKENY